MATLIKYEQLHKSFNTCHALKNINLEIGSGKIVGLLGPNGSGKTTLLRLAAGLLAPTSGQILINGKTPCAETKAEVSYLADNFCLPSSKNTKELISFYADFYTDFDKAKAAEMLKSLNISATQKLSAMSKGTKDKVQLILAMSRNAKLYLLDEPIGGVDPASRDFILNTIIKNYNENASVIFSTHLIADIEKVLDEVVFINKGEITLYENTEKLREEKAQSIDSLFREVYKC